MTDTDITIPPEALEAAAQEIAMTCRCAMACDWRDHKEDARAACLAMLATWPGMRIMVDIDTGDDAAIKLPLTETPDAKVDQIPDVVWRVAMMTYHREIRRNPEQAWQLAIAAAITTWPGMWIDRSMKTLDPESIILPITQETPDE